MRQRLCLLIFVTIALALGFLYFVPATCSQHLPVCLSDPSTSSFAPFIYRVLQPALERWVAPTIDPFSVGMLQVDMLLQIVTIIGTIPALYLWLKRWLEPDRAVQGVLVFGLVYILAYHLYFRSISTSLEVLFVVWGLVLIDRGGLWFVPLVVLASLNRETGLVLAGIYGAYHGRDQWRNTAALAGIWILITAGLHIVIPSAPHVLGLTGTFEYNLANMPDALLTNLLLLPLAIMIVAGYRKAPIQLRRLAWVAAIYALAIVVGAAWNETQRLILPISPLLLPIALNSLSSDTSRPSSSFQPKSPSL